MKKEIIIDLHGVATESDILAKFAAALNIQDKYLLPKNWNALEDDISCLSFPNETEIDEVLVILLGVNDVINNISEEIYLLMISVLAADTDPAQRGDKINFLFQVRLE